MVARKLKIAANGIILTKNHARVHWQQLPVTAEKEFASFEFEEEEAPNLTTVFTPSNAPSKKRRRQIKKSGPFKKAKKKGKRVREVLFRTKVRKQLLREYHRLVARRKAINKKIRDNRRHRNQLVFHRT